MGCCCCKIILLGLLLSSALRNPGFAFKSGLLEECSRPCTCPCFPTYEPFVGPSPNQPGAQTNKLVPDSLANVPLQGVAFASRCHRLVPGKQLSQLIVGIAVWILLLDANCCGRATSRIVPCARPLSELIGPSDQTCCSWHGLEMFHAN